LGTLAGENICFHGRTAGCGENNGHKNFSAAGRWFSGASEAAKLVFNGFVSLPLNQKNCKGGESVDEKQPDAKSVPANRIDTVKSAGRLWAASGLNGRHTSKIFHRKHGLSRLFPGEKNPFWVGKAA